jgi:hypothetical protein
MAEEPDDKELIEHVLVASVFTTIRGSHPPLTAVNTLCELSPRPRGWELPQHSLKKVVKISVRGLGQVDWISGHLVHVEHTGTVYYASTILGGIEASIAEILHAVLHPKWAMAPVWIEDSAEYAYDKFWQTECSGCHAEDSEYTTLVGANERLCTECCVNAIKLCRLLLAKCALLRTLFHVEIVYDIFCLWTDWGLYDFL